MSAGELTFNRRAVRPMQCLRDGWQLIKEDYWLFLGITFVGMFMGNAAPMGLLMGPMMCGIYLCLLRRWAGQPVSFDMLFKGFDYFAQSLIAALLMIVPIFLLIGLVYGGFSIGMIAVVGTTAASSPNQEPDPTAMLIFTGVFGVVLVGVILLTTLLGILFMFTFPLIVDRGLSGVEALKLSARATWANFGGLLGLLMLLWLMSFVGLLACYVGVFFEYPLMFATLLTAYRQVFSAKGSILFEPPPPNWPEVGGRFDHKEETGVQPAPPDRPVSVTKTPDEPKIQQTETMGDQE